MAGAKFSTGYSSTRFGVVQKPIPCGLECGAGTVDEGLMPWSISKVHRRQERELCGLSTATSLLDYSCEYSSGDVAEFAERVTELVHRREGHGCSPCLGLDELFPTGPVVVGLML